MNARRIAASLAIAAASLMAAPAQAATVSYTYSAEVFYDNGSPVSLGDTITGTVSWDSAMTSNVLYSGGLVSISMTGPSFSASSNGVDHLGKVVVIDDEDDIFQVGAFGGHGAAASTLALVLVDLDGTVFNSSATPTSVDLADFEHALLAWTGWIFNGTEFVIGPQFTARIDTLAPVPLPATAWLMLSGIATLGAMARRRHTK